MVGLVEEKEQGGVGVVVVVVVLVLLVRVTCGRIRPGLLVRFRRHFAVHGRITSMFGCAGCGC